ncbi:TOBE domain-containing protein [Gephyromycinifex aptenodytis]|uniref:TOBE domain-containing protein n=1 Tax=Gephyromycinifex aptenodytis TaxID=2716227 RepID=UPI0014459661|nr:TOBE domain-containing protein [Gephyromycinifex aptenodytis]
MRLSTRNQIPGKVVSVTSGEAMAVVKVEIEGGQVLTSSITLDALTDLGIAVGKEVSLVIKSTDVALGVE